MKQKLLALTLMFSALIASGQKSYWKSVSVNEASKLNKGKSFFPDGFQASDYKLFILDEPAFVNLIAKAPYEKSVAARQSNLIISLPNAEGNVERFRLVEAPVMQPLLQAKHLDMRSYSGVGIDNPSSSLRCSFTPLGFHAMIRSVNRPTFYINTIDKSSHLYLVNARNINDKSENKLICETDELASQISKPENRLAYEGNADDGQLRIFRLALCSTGEFSRAQLNGSEVTNNDSIISVLAALNVYLTRANLLYEIDLGIRMVFVENEDTLIFLNPATDPFGNLNSACQKTCDARIGNENYDIGHVLQKGSDNGNAGCIACVCKTGSKGSGFSTYSKPNLIDYLVIDYWTHEMGHQYGANHTFTQSSEGTSAQIEPGSGSTIMGYAGITGSTDVQDHSDDYFSTASLAQISSYVKSASGKCSFNSESGNTAPTADAGADYTIPKSTPFMLRGSATDADGTDILSYVWEQVDVRETGSTPIPKSTNTKGPMFRSALYGPLPSRSFPELTNILDGSNGSKWEVLPSVSRDLNFRIVVRDNAIAGGNTATDNKLIVIAGDAGPFRITSPNTTVNVGEGSVQTITWDVANTDLAPINCSDVRISLSLDGGVSFPYVLAESTPNDGSEEITLPLIENSSITARVKIESIGNIFFDINDADFSIDGTLPVSWISFTAEKTGARSALLKWSTANEINNNYFAIERSADGINFKALGSVSANKQNQIQNNYSFVDNFIPGGINYYRIKQVDNDGRSSYSSQVRINIDANGVSWTLAPNPARDKTTIIFTENANPVQISINNTAGKEVFQKRLASVSAGDRLDIVVNNFAKGIYFVKIVSGTNTRIEKLVVN